MSQDKATIAVTLTKEKLRKQVKDGFGDFWLLFESSDEEQSHDAFPYNINPLAFKAFTEELKRLKKNTLSLTDKYCETREVEALKKPNNLLRSAYQIAKRNGSDVAWETFKSQLKIELDREHKIMYPKGANNG